MDVIYVVDSSDGVSTKTFDQLKSFVSNDVKTKDFSNDKVRAGILNYGSRAVLILAPKNGVSKSFVQTSISDMTRIKGQRNFKVTFNYILDTVLDDPQIVRVNSKKVVVLLVSGRSLDWSTTDAESFKEKFKKAGVEVVVIVTDENAASDMTNLVDNPDNIILKKGDDDLTDGSSAVTNAIAQTTG